VGTVLDVTARRKAEAERETLNVQLRDASRRVGMAEVATGVLHNVGNVLNSVNVAATFLHERLRGSRVTAVQRVARLLEGQDDLARFLTEDPRGKVVPAYLAHLSVELLRERDQLSAEVDGLRGHIDHIKKIVVMQQTLARAGGVTERCELADVLDEALSLETASFDKYAVEVVRNYEPAPEMVLDRHKLLQIVINLITNAKHALREATGPRRLEVRVEWSAQRGATITVADTGVGIPPENLERVFQHGFTSRPEGHGFGLHHSALSAKEMGGTLTGASDGNGLGACFTLTLPVSVMAQVRPVTLVEV